PMKNDSRKGKAEEIGDALRESVDFKSKHLDPSKIERKKLMREIMRRGSLRDFIAALRAYGITEDSKFGQELIAEYRKIYGL
ncbi:MAG TPA: hypothetical protein VEG08_05615, partial [Terriglobales bacterium]|nr:hypothetical protein [Terriglobales bacterium]